jgi:hypothetical protein
MSNLKALRAEHELVVIGPLLIELLSRVATATANTYPPDYSPTGSWNDQAVEDVLHDWVEDRLLRRKDLSKLLNGARSEGALRRGLTTSFGQHLTNHRRRSSVTNLYRRIAAMLRDDDAFHRVGDAGSPSGQPWTLAVSPAQQVSPLSENELVRLAFQLSDDDLAVIRYGPHSLKESPILRKPALREFLVHMLKGAEGTLSPATLIDVVRRRFNLVEPREEGIEEAIRAEAPSTSVETEVRAASVLARMGQSNSNLILALAEHMDPVEAAAAAGVEIATMERALSETMALVAEQATDAEEARAIYEAVVERLFGDSDEQ